MTMSISRRGVILMACVTGVAAWAVASKAAPQTFKVAADRCPTGAAGANLRYRNGRSEL